MCMAPHVCLRGRLDGNVQIPHLSCERGGNREISGVRKGGQEGRKMDGEERSKRRD